MNPAIRKGLTVVAVALLLLVPLAWLHGLVGERTAMRNEAIATVARGWGGRQTLSGPVIAIPVTTTLDDGKTRTSDWCVQPETLEIDADIQVEGERRKLGVYEVPVYISNIHVRAVFDIGNDLEKAARSWSGLSFHFGLARLVLPISDLRGVRDVPSLSDHLVMGRMEPSRGFPIAALAAPLASEVDLRQGKQTFDFTLQLAGTQSFSVLPLARATRVQLTGNWPSPGFASGFLPVERHIDKGRRT